jgi:hypothetical protein
MAEMSGFEGCPNCGSRSLKVTDPRSAIERIRSVLGIYQVRCRQCDHRFETGVLGLSDWRYAHCPRCYRTELSTWSQQYYNPAWSVRALLRLGATPYRCEFCRCNFASFLSCKERFSWRKRRVQNEPKPPNTNEARVDEDVSRRY